MIKFESTGALGPDGTYYVLVGDASIGIVRKYRGRWYSYLPGTDLSFNPFSAPVGGPYETRQVAGEILAGRRQT